MEGSGGKGMQITTPEVFRGDKEQENKRNIDVGGRRMLFKPHIPPTCLGASPVGVIWHLDVGRMARNLSG